MPRYPTEARHGSSGYRSRGGLSRPSGGNVVPLRTPPRTGTTVLGRVVTGPWPVNDPGPPTNPLRGLRWPGGRVGSVPMSYNLDIGFIGIGPNGQLGITYIGPELVPVGTAQRFDYAIPGASGAGTDPAGYMAPQDGHITWTFQEYPGTAGGTGNYAYSESWVGPGGPHLGYPGHTSGGNVQIFPSSTAPPDEPVYDFFRNTYPMPGTGWPNANLIGTFNIGMWEQTPLGAWNIRGRWVMADATPNFGEPGWPYNGPHPDWQPGHYPASAPVYQPFAVPVPAKQPNTWPIMRPVDIVPAGYPETLPQPGQQPVLEPVPSPRTAPTTVPMPNLPPGLPGVITPPAVSPSPGVPPVPVQPPTVIITPIPGGGIDVVTTPGSPGRTPPPASEKQQKAYTSAGPRGIRVVVNAATEMGDFINSLYAGVPKELRKHNCHHYDYVCQLRTLWDVWDDPRFNAAEFISTK